MSIGLNGPVLAGFRIVEMSAFIAAPLAGATLAGLGADVIRIDPPGGGIDRGRWPIHNHRSLYWAGLNQGKRSVVIDTDTEAGRRQAIGLITAPGEGGGILLTNLPAHGWNSYAELSKRRPDLIVVAITGTHDGRSAVDYTVNAGLGFPYVTGPEETEGPINSVLPAWDAATAYLATTAILIADRYRTRTGKGQLIELSLADVGLAVAAHLGFIGEAILNDAPRGRFGNYVYGTLGRDFSTTDGRRVIVLALTTRQWLSLVEATGLRAEFQRLETDHGVNFREEGDRWNHRKAICSLLDAWIGRRPLIEVAEIFTRYGVLWGPYRTFKQLVVEDPMASAENPMLSEVQHPGLGRFLTTGSPLRFSAAASVRPKPAPELGQHTTEVLTEFQLEY